MEENKKSFFSCGKKKEEQKTNKIEIEFQVQRTTLGLNEIIEYAKGKLNNQDSKIDEVMILDNQTNPQILEIINKQCKIQIDESMSVIYLLDAYNKAITKILILCVDAFSEELSEELANNNHIIRLNTEKEK